MALFALSKWFKGKVASASSGWKGRWHCLRQETESRGHAKIPDILKRFLHQLDRSLFDGTESREEL
ncbi:MAG: DUF3146 family protein [Victivallales bacterium]|nr:DUF3146 family protein [Victivallales bacterium]